MAKGQATTLKGSETLAAVGAGPDDNIIGPPPQYIWEPRQGINAYDLALCLPVLLAGGPEDINKLPARLRIHWRLVGE